MMSWIRSLAAAFILGLASVVSAADNSPKPEGEPPDSVTTEKTIHERILKTVPPSKLRVWGDSSPDVQACLWIPVYEWNALAEAEKKALADYLKSRIPEIRANPDDYLKPIPKTAPLYAKFRKNVANMKDGKFIIFTMERRDERWLQSKTVAESD